MWLARRILLHEPTQLVLSVLGIGLSLMLVIVLLGVLDGVQTQAGDYLDNVPGSVVVASSGSENFLVAAVPLPSGTIDTVRANPDVVNVVPILSRMVVLQMHERREATFVVGFDPAIGGGPRRLTAGRAPADRGEIALGRLLARRHGVGVGDVIDVAGREFSVTGLTDDQSPLMTSFVYVTKSSLEEMTMLPGASSVLIVTPRDGVSPEVLRARLAGIPDTSVLLKEQVITNDVRLFTGPFQPVIRLMAGISILAGTLVVGVLVYAAALQRRRDYGVLKATGIRNHVLYRLVAAQALTVAALGTVAGLVLAVGVARLIMALRPEFLIPVTWPAALLAAIAAFGMALFAAVAPARVIAGLAPADVFRR
jgi:putative ABC transport system permease protein